MHSDHPLDSPEYDKCVSERKYKVEPHIPRFAEFEKWRGKRVLDLGAGIGTDAISFAKAGAEVTAVDLSPKSLEVAKTRSHLNNLAIRFYEGNAEELYSFLPIEPYDLVYAFGSIHHSPRPRRILEQIYWGNKPGTVVKIMMYNRWSWKALKILLLYAKGRFWRWREFIAKHSEAQTGCPVTYAFTKREIRRLMESCGFVVDKIEVAHIFSYKVESYRKYRYEKTLLFKYMPPRVFKWLESKLGWHLLVTAHVAD